MKKLTILTAMVLLYSVTGALYAQGLDVLNSLYAEMSSSAADIDFSYTLTSSKLKTTGEGDVLVQGAAYRMQGNGVEFYCDGTTVWAVDQAGKEVIIESPAEGEQAYLMNPALLLVNMDSAFTVQNSKRNGSLITCTLLPKVSCGIVSAVLNIDDSGKIPVISSASFTLDDDSQLDIKIKSMTLSDKKPLTTFFYDISSLDSFWLITDLR